MERERERERERELVFCLFSSCGGGWETCSRWLEVSTEWKKKGRKKKGERKKEEKRKKKRKKGERKKEEKRKKERRKKEAIEKEGREKRSRNTAAAASLALFLDLSFFFSLSCIFFFSCFLFLSSFFSGSIETSKYVRQLYNLHFDSVNHIEIAAMLLLSRGFSSDEWSVGVKSQANQSELAGISPYGNRQQLVRAAFQCSLL